MTNDDINHPRHYTLGAKVIDALEAWQLGFHLGNVVKYVARAGKKTPAVLPDLRKARWYLDRYITRLEQLEDENGRTDGAPR